MSKEEEIKKGESLDNSKKITPPPPPKPELNDPSRLIESEIIPSRNDPSKIVKSFYGEKLQKPKDDLNTKE